jgi:hypothetical protein
VIGAPQKESTLRWLTGIVSLVTSLVVLAGSFVQMVRALEATGYGSTGVTTALIWMSVGGGLLGLGMALMIWELSVRYNIRH